MRNLSELLPEEWGEVLYIEKKSALLQRFTDIGIIPGTKIQCVAISPLGDPIAYFVRGVTISLRKEDSENVIIR